MSFYFLGIWDVRATFSRLSTDSAQIKTNFMHSVHNNRIIIKLKMTLR